MKNIAVYLLIVILLSFSSCGDFLEEYSQSSTYVESVADLEELLLGAAYMQRKVSNMTSFPNYLHILADESRENPIAHPFLYSYGQDWKEAMGFNIWAENPFTNDVGKARTDSDWGTFYNRISVINSILSVGPEYQGGTKAEEEQLSRIVGECYYLRAWNYFMLANIYGAAYDKRNPDDEASVTLKLDPVIEETKFKRSSTGEVYNRIVEDLKLAVTYLEQGSRVGLKVHVTPAAAYALLSRVYLYMEEYDLAVKAADAVKGYMLSNLVNYVPGSGESFLTSELSEVIHVQGMYGVHYLHKETGFLRSTPHYWMDSEGIWHYDTKFFSEVNGVGYVVSPDLSRLFNKNDARYSAFFTRSYGVDSLVVRKYRHAVERMIGETDPVTRDTVDALATGNDFCEAASIRYAEVVLNKAEAQACGGDPGAVQTMRDFLVTRYFAPPVIPVSGKELIEFIRQERRKELCFEGHRWFDLRRYAVNTVYPQAVQITHEWHTITAAVASVSGSYTLKPYSEETKGSWIFPVPEDVINYCFPELTNFDRITGIVEN